MTPFRNDDANPFARSRDYPGLTQTPMRLSLPVKAPLPPPPRDAPRYLVFDRPTAFAPLRPAEPASFAPRASEPIVAAPVPAAESTAEPVAPAEPFLRPIGQVVRMPKRQPPRLAPLVGAGAAGAVAVIALFVLLGDRAARRPGAIAAVPVASALPVTVGPAETAPPVRDVAPAPLRVLVAARARSSAGAARSGDQPAPVRLDVPAAPLATAPPPRELAARPALDYRPPSAPSPDGPIARRVPDGG